MPPTVRPWRSGAVALVVALLALAGGPAPATAIPGAAPQARVLTPLAGTSDEGASLLSDATERYIVSVYLDLFGREPDAPGLQAWTNALLTGTPRVAVANGITYSREFRAGLITDAYDYYLGRGPDPAGLEGWLGAMDAGLTIARIEAGFIASPEYFSRSGGTFEGWVSQLYADVLGRDAARAEVDAWADQLRLGASRGTVALGFLLSWEHLSTVVDGYYQHLLGRGLDAVGQRAWIQILQAGGRDEAIIGGIVASDEYWSALGVATGITVSLVEETVDAGDPVHVSVQAVDRWGAPVAYVTHEPGVAITMDGRPCDGALCRATTAGRATVKATYGTWLATAEVDVALGDYDRLEVSIAATAVAGNPVPYTVAAFDAGGNFLGDVTDQVTLSGVPGIAFSGAKCSAGTCTFLSVGTERLSVALQPPGHLYPIVERDDIEIEVLFPPAPAASALYAWGIAYGALPEGHRGPSAPALDAAWDTVTTGASHTVALRTDGTMWEWGIGSRCFGRSFRPTLVDGNDWAFVDAAEEHNVALRGDGTLWGWGTNGDQQMGGPSTTCIAAPRALPGGPGAWTAATTAAGATYAISADGSLWGWGDNAGMGVGDGTTTTAGVATRIGTEAWTAVAGGGRGFTSFVLGIRADGTLWRWGTGAGGDSAVPLQVGVDSDWVVVEAGAVSGAAIKADGSLWVWGGRDRGLMPGADPAAPADLPVKVGAGIRWTGVALGADTAIAVADDGSVWGWGRNWSDQLANGRVPVTTPTQIAAGTTWTAVSLGDNLAVGLR